MRKPRPEQIKRAAFADSVVQHLTTHQQTTKEIAAHFGVNRTWLYKMLRELMLGQEIHQIRIPKAAANGGLPVVLWTAGTDPNGAPPEDSNGFQPKHKIVQSWPIHNFRDELVAALFGPAGEACHG